jgi:hypothetical protein
MAISCLGELAQELVDVTRPATSPWPSAASASSAGAGRRHPSSDRSMAIGCLGELALSLCNCIENNIMGVAITYQLKFQ